MHHKLVYYCCGLFLIIRLVEITRSYEFPAEQFFWSAHVDLNNSSTSPYLCQTDITAFKCCSCLKDCLGDCCIDVHWNKTRSYTLEDYLHTFIQKHEKKLKHRHYCQPIVPSLLPQQKTLHMIMKTCHNQNANTLIPSRNRQLHLPVVHKPTDQYYPNKFCAFDDRVTATSMTYLKVTAECMEVRNISVGTNLTFDYQNYLIDCIFDLYDNSNSPWWSLTEQCGFYQSKCDNISGFFDLCDVYSAPTAGFKNPHCYFCEKENSKKMITLEKCKQMHVLYDDYPFSLVIQEKENRTVIEKIKYKFPLLGFFGLEREKVELKHRSLLLGCDRSCCNCDLYCFKFRSCCADALWDYNAKPVIDMQQYRQSILTMSKDSKTHTCRIIKKLIDISV